jgi:CHASE3 domain sensor protein
MTTAKKRFAKVAADVELAASKAAEKAEDAARDAGRKLDDTVRQAVDPIGEQIDAKVGMPAGTTRGPVRLIAWALVAALLLILGALGAIAL